MHTEKELKELESYIKAELTDIMSVLGNAVQEANSFVKGVGEVYNSIGKNFPAIEKEINEENEEANLLIEYFLYQNDDSSDVINSEAGLSYELKQNQENFFASVDKMQKFIEDDNRISNSIIEGVEKVNIIMESIDRIRSLADQIKVYSLNAIIVSSKQGSAGRAFGEISKNIIKLSDNSNQQADMMAKMGNKLFSEFDEFKRALVDVNEKQKYNFSEIREKVVSAYDKLNSTFRVFASLIKDLIDRVDSTKKIIFEIMVVLQKEDIIRQHTEHIVDSIQDIITEERDFLLMLEEEEDKLESQYADPEHEGGHISEGLSVAQERLDKAFLDLLTFKNDILSLVISQLQTVEKEINETNENVGSHLNDMKKQITNIQGDRDNIIKFLAGGESDVNFPVNALDNAFQEYLEFMRNYVEQFNSSLSAKDKISQGNERITDTIEDLEELFDEAKGISSTFNSINFLAKIELEKNMEMFTSSETFSINSVDTIASNISKTVNESLEGFDSIKEDLFHSLDDFKQSIKAQEKEYDNIKERVGTVDDRLSTSKNMIKDNINSLENYSRDLVMLIDATSTDMNSLENLIVDINKMMHTFTSIKEKVGEKKKEFLKKVGMTKWPLSSEKYKSIIGRYTIRQERLVANSVLEGVEEDLGSDSGDLTLF